ERADISLSRTAMARWTIKASELSLPLISLMHTDLLDSPVMHADETTVQVLNEPNKTAESTSYMWCLARSGPKPIICYSYHDNRSQKAAADLLVDFKGTLIADAYKVYDSVQNVLGFKLAGCWALTIDWDLIEKHFSDMLRIAISIKAGHVTAATVLRRHGTQSRKNKVYFAFRELGRVIRTIFLLSSIGDPELRRTIQAFTNESEAFNGFSQSVSFGGGGIIAENDRDEKRKVIKYNHLVASVAILQTVNEMSKVLIFLKGEGHEFSQEALAAMSPYRRELSTDLGTIRSILTRCLTLCHIRILVQQWTCKDCTARLPRPNGGKSKNPYHPPN
ncbi:MAG: Tn3 family transposase, partial [Chitinophagaceae bacterium]|nr:Tn3 family transposase [Oligoflexus sp.]